MSASDSITDLTCTATLSIGLLLRVICVHSCLIVTHTVHLQHRSYVFGVYDTPVYFPRLGVELRPELVHLVASPFILV